MVERSNNQMEQTIEERKVSYFALFLSFFKIGVFTIGGGYAMVPLIEQEVVARRGWVETDSFIDLLTLAQSAPGPIALNSAAFVGYRKRGYVGSLCAVLGIVVPAFVIILVVALFFSSIRHNQQVEAAFKGVRPAVVALILAPTISLMKGMNVIYVAVTLLAMVGFTVLEISPVFPLLGAIVLSLAWTYVKMRGEGQR